MAFTEKEISALESFFANAKLPKEVKLYEGSSIHNIQQFINSHLNVLRNNGDKPIFEVFYQRLIHLKNIINLWEK